MMDVSVTDNAGQRPHQAEELQDEASILKTLSADIKDQDDLERDITAQAGALLLETEDKKDQARINKLRETTQRHVATRQAAQEKFKRSKSTKDANDVAKLDTKIRELQDEIIEFEARMVKRHQDAEEAAQTGRSGTSRGKSGRLPGESHRQYLLRTGKITPFAPIGGQRPEGISEGDLADAIIEAEEEALEVELDEQTNEPTSHQVLRMPGFSEAPSDLKVAKSGVQDEFGLWPRTKRKTRGLESSDGEYQGSSRGATPASVATTTTGDSDPDALGTPRKRRKTAASHGKKAVVVSAAGEEPIEKIDLSRIDDGNEASYRNRLSDWVDRRHKARQAHRLQQQQHAAEGNPIDDSAHSLDDTTGDEWLKPAPDNPSWQVDDKLKIPGDIHPSLFGYQKTGVQWLTELYKQQTGGIIADEMGLGKTVQIIAFIAALHHSNLLKKPVIVVAPATVLQQWVNEFHRWWPPLRVSILHASGSGMMNLKDERDYNDGVNRRDRRSAAPRSLKAARSVVDRVIKDGHVLVTTYTGLGIYADELLHVDWGYAVLDEGHKIRNPNADVTITCKELNTPHRIILSGTPVQNNLSELWSLFDFVYPMRLGTLVNFRNQFEIPIRMGGYANASALQIMTAERCAATLKDTISKYLLQRLKVDVAADLPAKTEQVLFCKLTQHQRDAYTQFLNSDDVTSILAGRKRSLAGIDTLRKICNHLDLLKPDLETKPEYQWASPDKSTKLQVVQSLLKIWTRFGHKTLLFSQGKLILNILESFLKRDMPEVNFVRMDGETQIEQRQILIDRFNSDPDLHLFLLTTRTGGLGVNLTGADRIIIFDPDWNPSTDMQARERAWRLGQTKPVSIYRLMTSGTIEEKIYRRQIFKQFMTSKVLHDPKQRVAFDLSDLYDLFTPPDSGEGSRGEIFDKARVKFASAASGDTIRPGGDGKSTNITTSVNPAVSEAATLQYDISNLATSEEFCGDDDYPSAHTEKRMVEGIFSRTVDSAYEHDRIVTANGRPKIQADRAALQAEADRVAAVAAAHLSRAADEARAVPIGTVTWTGEVGSAGRPETSNARRGRGGPASSSLLMPLQASSSVLAPRGSASPVASSSSLATSAPLHARNFEGMIADFIRRQGGQVPSKMLVDHFNRHCRTKQATDEFKKALDRTATLTRGGGTGRGIWSLK